MKLSLLLSVHASILILSGIAFGLYAPLMMGFFDIAERLVDPYSYWQVAAFVRMFGAALFGMGLLLLSVRGALDEFSRVRRREVVSALLIANIMAGVVAVTQGSVWTTPAGWILAGLFIVLILAYGVFLLQKEVDGSPVGSKS
jgi:hypothetical protein